MPSSWHRRVFLIVLPHFPTIRVPMTMRRRVTRLMLLLLLLPRTDTIGLYQGVLRRPHRRRLPRNDIRFPRFHTTHVRVHQSVMVIYIGMRIVLDEVETLLPTVGILHRFTELVEAQISRTIGHAPVPQVRPVVNLVELAHRTLLFFRQADEFPPLVEANVSLALLREDVELPTEVLGLCRELLVGCIIIAASHGLDRAAHYGNIAAAASRVETHGAHHRRYRPAHHHHQEAQNLR